MSHQSSRRSSSHDTDDDDYPHPPAGANEDEYRAELMEFLQESRDMRQAAKSSLKQGLWAGGGSVAGGLLLGPVGGLVGGVAGSLVGFYRADNYDGAVQQLLQLPAARQSRLVRGVAKILSTTTTATDFFESPEAFRTTLAEYATQRAVRDQIWRLCTEALSDGESSSAEAPETVLTS